MQASKKFSVVLTFAALSLSGSAAWAVGGNSFVAKAEVNGLKVVPSVLTSLEVLELAIPFGISPPTTSRRTIALVQPRNPWRLRTRRPSNEIFPFSNMRLYFGQHFSNGQPILTLCDEDIGKTCEAVCKEVESKTGVESSVCKFTGGVFELSDIQFQEQQIIGEEMGGVTIPSGAVILSDRRLTNDKSGLKAIRHLIEQGLIYVVINSKFEATLDPETDDIIYTPPAPDPTNRPRANVKQRDLTTQFRDLFRIVDGDLRGTLCLGSPKKCPSP